MNEEYFIRIIHNSFTDEQIKDPDYLYESMVNNFTLVLICIVALFNVHKIMKSGTVKKVLEIILFILTGTFLIYGIFLLFVHDYCKNNMDKLIPPKIPKVEPKENETIPDPPKKETIVHINITNITNITHNTESEKKQNDTDQQSEMIIINPDIVNPNPKNDTIDIKENEDEEKDKPKDKTVDKPEEIKKSDDIIKPPIEPEKKIIIRKKKSKLKESHIVDFIQGFTDVMIYPFIFVGKKINDFIVNLIKNKGIK